MTRPSPLLMTTVVVTLIGGTGVLAQTVPVSTRTAVIQLARAGQGSLHGVVSDEAGGPVEGATVSAIGEAMAFAVTDRKGRFGFDNLPVGRYLVRVHRSGFSLSQREYVQIQPSARVVKHLELRRDGAVGTSGTPDTPARVLAAGLGEPGDLPANAPAAEPADAAGSHPHNEAAWRLRHVRRSVLKEASETIALATEPAGEDFARRAQAFPAVLDALPFSGEINLLTTSALDRAGDIFTGGLPRGVTYVQLGSANDAATGWAMQAAVSQGDISSWIVAGSFTARGPREHAVDMGLSFGAQEYAGGNLAALAVRSDGSRRVGTIYGYHNWAVSPLLHVAYGARVARYDYVSRDELWNPRLAVAFNVAEGTHVRASVAQGFRAPGAEEFLPPQSGGPWLPPERTFSPLGTTDFRVERIREVELTLERELRDSAVVAFRRFFEAVDNQLVTVFGARSVSTTRSDIGHYLIGTAGGVDADGWGVKVSSPVDRRLRGSLDYSLTRARWLPSGAVEAVERLAPSAVRPATEDVHDVSTSVEADITETATRVFFYYRISTGYARDDEAPTPALGGRFDLQVRQGLPFMPFRGSEWQVLVGIRDLFRDPLDTLSSTYDELLVVRPPKRVMGGVQVKF